MLICLKKWEYRKHERMRLPEMIRFGKAINGIQSEA